MIMTSIGGLLLLIATIIDIILVVKIFQQDGAMKGIIALITCGIYSYIWGWQHAKAQNLGKMMWTLTICAILGTILYYAGIGSAMSAGGGGGVPDLPTPEATQEGFRIISNMLHM